VASAPDAPADAVEVLDRPEAGVKALRGGVIRTAGYAVGLLLGLISMPLLVRHLGVVDFGRYVTVTSIVGLVAGATEGGLNALALREYARTSGDERRTVMRNMLGMRVVITASGAVAAIVLAAAAGYDNEMVLGAVGAAAALLFLTGQDFMVVGLQGDLRFGLATAAELVRQVATTTLLVALVLAGAGLVPLLWVPLPAGIIGFAFAVALVRGRMPRRPSFDLARWRPLLRDTIPYAIAIAIGVAYFRAAMLVTSLASTEVQAGYFATSFRIVEMLVTVPGLLIGAAFPILARSSVGDRLRHTTALQRIVELALLAGAFTGLVTALIAPFAISVLAGPDFSASVPVLRIHAIALAANFVAVALLYGLLSAGRHGALVAGNGVALLTVVVLTVVLASEFGAEGAAVATAAAEWLLVVTLVVATLRWERSLGRAAAIAPPVALATAVGAAALLLPVHSVIQTVAGVAAFTLVLAVLGRFPPEIREILSRSAGRGAL
jgi:O-antigen/teichoic acid export membrane protein